MGVRETEGLGERELKMLAVEPMPGLDVAPIWGEGVPSAEAVGG